jgi:7,8-dihydropterin-6-yl-methyl-4-(beta-D-ribofuranosyl)aminobenzene 5'-phosphate synthase
MLADGRALGEWGFAALVEADGHRILYDTGAHPDVVLKNAQTLRVDLMQVPDVVLSHSHLDHIGGLITLRQSVLTNVPTALAFAHVGEGIFYPRSSAPSGTNENSMLAIRSEYERCGGKFAIYDRPKELFPGVWLTGPVPRKYPEHNWSGSSWISTPHGEAEDTLPEDMALVCNTDSGLVVITGCGHAGVINILDYARAIVRPSRIHALIGGIHLFAAKEEVLNWTAEKMREFGVDNFLGAHCTGIETVYRFRHDLKLDRAHAVVDATGATFELGAGINPGLIAK